ncbi:hypothetical protein KAFR_0C06430 [Kazachstania africana CBS 2517]|uniref:Uncharacterized protein n=1 Tax=Kazachstania africana (strain ATCC 22294 / BCRC 22015 / CBS 2517 / CECT 1963 / NBRC 1671 / NRRL Y-8276) TaxID=1071382 RepID=H2ATD9_KAZAF|nr:hypothetical protein KAFR_0C06430 [Kazachstania africana CBS 2517]CCF57639.1 hypothetical protein KAFR_0C06430 [Kazachstania africana CBS 2517]
MQSLIDQANSGHRFGANPEKKEYWKLDWFTPAKQDSFSANSETNDTANETNRETSQEKYNFKYQTWVKIDSAESIPSEENDTLQPIDLSIIDRNEVSDGNQGNTDGNKDSLTVDDIRGAVGGSESIPGLSSGTNNNHDLTEPAAEETQTVVNTEQAAEQQTSTAKDVPADLVSQTTTENILDTPSPTTFTADTGTLTTNTEQLSAVETTDNIQTTSTDEVLTTDLPEKEPAEGNDPSNETHDKEGDTNMEL